MIREREDRTEHDGYWTSPNNHDQIHREVSKQSESVSLHVPMSI